MSVTIYGVLKLYFTILDLYFVVQYSFATLFKCFVLFCRYFLEIVPTSDVDTAFKNVGVAILVGAMPRREGMERKDLLKANVKIFKQQGQALDQFAQKSVKVCIALTCVI